MRWITLFAFAASLAAVSFGAESEAPAAPPAQAAEEEETKLDGVVVERTNGGFLTLTMDGKKLVVRFFDSKKKPMTPDVRTGFVRFQFSNRSPERRPLFLTEDGQGMTHGEPLRPPHVFKAFITLRTGEATDADGDDEAGAEKYVVDFP
jgi:hypothetical protein